MSSRVLRLPALEIQQGPDRRLYSFAVDGKRLPEITTVSRIRRDEGELDGYQRPEALAHVNAIRRYLESPSALMPNAIVVAFDTRVVFKARKNARTEGSCRVGELVVPLVSEEDEKPGWLVDGQQRSAALRDARVESFPVPMVAFITDDLREQRSQFILVNNTKPLPTGLINELLPATEGELPVPLLRRRFPALLLEQLNFRAESPLKEMIRTPTTIEGVIKDTSMLKMLDASMTDGALYRYRDPDTGQGDIEAMLELLFAFWEAVKVTWPDDWGEPPRKSRLAHGAGVAALGYVMDEIVDHRAEGETMPDTDAFAADLELLKPHTRWSSGSWAFGKRYDEVQVVPSHVAELTGFLLDVYRRETSPRRRSAETARKAA